MKDQNILCSGCNRKIIKNTHDKCLYCGTAFPVEFHLSKEERKQKELDEKIFRHKQEMENSTIKDVFTHIERHKRGDGI